MATISLRDGQTLFVRVIGQGRPVLMLHGLGMDSRHWLPFIWHLRHKYRFFLPDFRGAGRSDKATFNQLDVFQNHMEDMEDVVNALKLKKFLLVGYSLGATTALHWQNAGGFKRVRAYLHIDQSPCVINRPDWPYGLFGQEQQWVFARLTRLLPMLEKTSAVRLAQLPLEEREELLHVLGDVFSRMLGRATMKPVFRIMARLPWLMPSLLPVTRVADLHAYLVGYTRLVHDYLPGLATCEVPVTVLIGRHSPLYAEAGQRAVAETVPDGKVIVLSRSGHVPLIDQPIAFARELAHFLRQSA